MAPAGAGPSAAKNSDGSDWWKAFDPPTTGIWKPLAQPMQGHEAAQQRERLVYEVAEAVFDRAGRDIESVGLGVGACNWRDCFSRTAPDTRRS